MKEQVISFETAKLAKEKGFDIPVMGFFSHPSEYEPELTEYNVDEDLVEPLEIKNWNTQDDFPWLYYSAPTQSLLQKWLREEHHLSVKVDDFYTNSRVRYDYNVSALGSQDDNPVGIFETYEEALEAGLYTALEHIGKAGPIEVEEWN